MIDGSKFTWKDNKLYLGSEYVGEVFSIEENLWWIKFSNGELSEDYYNETRAKDNLIKLITQERNLEMR